MSKVQALPPVSSLIAETENLLHRQRQKGPEYKYREGAGRPDLVAAGLLPASSRTAAASSPTKPSAPATDEAGGETSGPADLDDYDPKEAAARELRELTETVRGKNCARAHLLLPVLWMVSADSLPPPSASLVRPPPPYAPR